VKEPSILFSGVFDMQWQEVVNKAVDLRQWFHRHPELTWQEKNTAAKIRQCLTDWQVEWRACATYGTVATLGKGKQGEHIALRADMDALPIQEQTSLDFQSEVDGKMHACGHDGHMAALLGTILWLKLNEVQLKHPVSFLFQPAEEGGHGAKHMTDEGALEGIDFIYGWHNWPAMPFGTAVCPNGAVMSGNGSFHIQVSGLGGHASQPEVCQDPVLAAAAITLNLQQIVSRKMPPQAAVVLSVTHLNAESSVTVIPQTAEVSGGIRLSDPKYRPQINQLITEIAQQTAAAYGVTAQVEIRPRYEATINHPQAAQNYRQVLAEVFGQNCDQVDLMLPIMASEDFSYYLQQIPGAFALLGMSDQTNASFSYACHSPHYQFNDQLIERVMRVFINLAIKY